MCYVTFQIENTYFLKSKIHVKNTSQPDLTRNLIDHPFPNLFKMTRSLLTTCLTCNPINPIPPFAMSTHTHFNVIPIDKMIFSRLRPINNRGVR